MKRKRNAKLIALCLALIMLLQMPFQATAIGNAAEDAEDLDFLDAAAFGLEISDDPSGGCLFDMEESDDAAMPDEGIVAGEGGFITADDALSGEIMPMAASNCPGSGGWWTNGWPGDDPTISPGIGWSWSGGSKGSWTYAGTKAYLRPDFNHAEPIGRHWDYRDPDCVQWRIYPNGKMEKK